VETLIKQEEEETLGQLRDRLRLLPGLARVPGPRAPFVHIKVEDTSSGEATDGKGGFGGRAGGNGRGRRLGRGEGGGGGGGGGRGCAGGGG